ncbi:hypothetical protein [Janibacter melonis]|uniref:hypothetical protein n=1 Tax=Janibacter melonis TaxID=262209 RepID=UPI002094C5AE|nr:hypothetical protein [Janibacter melonis]
MPEGLLDVSGARQRGATGEGPTPGRVEVCRSLGDVDPDEQSFVAGVAQGVQQLAAAGADVGDRVRAGVTRQAEQGRREGSPHRPVGRGLEVTGRSLRAAVEAALAVQRVVPRAGPGAHARSA